MHDCWSKDPDPTLQRFISSSTKLILAHLELADTALEISTIPVGNPKP